MGRKKAKKRRFSVLKLALAALIILLVAGAVISFFPALLFTSAAVTTDAGSGSGAGVLSGDTVNIALLGFDGTVSPDREQNIYRPDTILVAAFNFRSGDISMVSIPRDSYVKIHGTDTYDKINHSFMYGHYRAGEGENRYRSGVDTTLKTVVDFLGGVPLHGHIVVDIKGAESIIDSIGGIYYDVEEEVRDEFGRGRLLVEEGYQRLDGSQFMDYLRNRAGFQGGERGRTERQQDIMIALFEQFKQPANIPRIPILYGAVRENVNTDLSLPQLLGLGLFGLRVTPAEIDTAVFSGSGQLSYRDGQNIWYLVVDESDRVSTIENIFGVTVEQRSMPALPGPVTTEPEDPEPEPEPEPEEEKKEDPDPEQPEEPEENGEAEQDPGNDLEPGENDEEEETNDAGEEQEQKEPEEEPAEDPEGNGEPAPDENNNRE